MRCPGDQGVEQAATGRATLLALLIALSVGAVILVPALAYLYTLFQRAPTTPGRTNEDDQSID